MKPTEIAGLLEKATPGPWYGDDSEVEVWSEDGSWIADASDSNAALIAAAPSLAALALSLMDERDRLRMQVRSAEDVIAKAAAVIAAETDEGLAVLCAIQAWQITPTEMYYRNDAEMDAARATLELR